MNANFVTEKPATYIREGFMEFLLDFFDIPVRVN